MIGDFSLERVQSSPAGFDPAKLEAFQERYMRELPAGAPARAVSAISRAGRSGGVDSDDAIRQTVAAIVEAAGDRLTVAGDVLDYADFFTADDELPYDEQAFEKRLRKPPEAASCWPAFASGWRRPTGSTRRHSRSCCASTSTSAASSWAR